MLPVAAGLIVFRKMFSKIEYLMLQRPNPQFVPINVIPNPHYAPPKGLVDKDGMDKDELDTAMRWTSETTTLQKCDLRVYDVCKILKYDVTDKFNVTKCKTVTYFLAELINPKAEVRIFQEHHQKFKWVEIDEACKLGKYKSMEKMLRECDQYLKKKVSYPKKKMP